MGLFPKAGFPTAELLPNGDPTTRPRRRKAGREIGMLLLAFSLLIIGGCAKAHAPLLLAKGIERFNAGDLQAAEPLLRASGHSGTVGPWARYYLGRVLQEKKDYGEARRIYATVPLTSASSIDARVSSLHAALLSGNGPDNDSEDKVSALQKLEEEAKSSWRSDLLPEISYLKGRSAEKAGNASLALAFYQVARKSHIGSPFAARAKDDAQRLLQDRTPTFHDQIDEADSLFKEGLFDTSLRVLRKALKDLKGADAAQRTMVWWQGKMLEYKILRALQKKDDARAVLERVSKEAQGAIAEQALHQLMLDDWNAGENKKALALADQYVKRFPSGTGRDEIVYIKGRMLEEMGNLKDASATYSDIAANTTSGAAQLRAFRQRAWVSLKQGDQQEAAKDFAQAITLAKNLINTTARSGIPREYPDARTRAAALRDLLNDLTHAQFWQSRIEKDEAKARNLRRAIMRDQPFGYYAALVARLHPEDAAPAGRSADKGPAETPTGDAACDDRIPAGTEDVFEELRAGSLPHLSEKEIDWYYARIKDTPAFTVGRLFGRAEMHARYARQNKSLDILDVFVLSSFPSDELGQQLIRCQDRLLSLSFPFLYQEVFAKAADKHELPVSSLLAIARTESHFNPKARSTSNALGLMQLLPKTAEEQGLQRQEDLFVPEINIDLGSKYFARLLKKYDGEIIFAIAAYNGGPGSVDRWRKRYPDDDPLSWAELIAYPETKNYVRKVFLATRMYEEQLARSRTR